MFNKNRRSIRVRAFLVFVLITGFLGVFPSPVFADTVGSISGTVYETDGVTPIENIYVAVSGDPNYFASDCTDASGEFTLADLPLDVQLQVQAAPPWANCGQWSDYVQEFWQDTKDPNSASLVTLDTQNPDLTDINFTLDTGGVISGTVYAADGVTPLQNIAVSFQNEDNSYGNSVCTDASGQYEFHGAPFDMPLRVRTDAYWDPWCNAGVNLVSEYWQEASNSTNATFLTVTALSPTQTGIDFTLDPGGSVSGTVYEADGVTPISNVVVSLNGNYYSSGACTDDLGHYTIHDVPFGPIVRAQAAPGGDNWCGGPNNYLTEFWQEKPSSNNAALLTVTAQAPDQMDIDFTLDVGLDLYKTLHVVPGNPEVHGHDWPSGADVTLTVDADANSGNGVLYTEIKNADDDPLWCGYPCFDLNGVFTLEVGQYVTLTDGSTSKTVLVSPLAVTNIDFGADTISGIADPGSRVAINIWSQNGIARYVTTAGDGTWIADFSAVGDEDFEQQLADIQPGDNGRAIQLNPDDSDDGTLEYWNVPSPHLDVWYMDDNINAYDWPLGTHLTLEIEDSTTLISPDYSTETDVTGFTSWNPKTTLGSFNLNDQFEITPGMIVTVSGASFTRELVIANLSVTSIDLANDTVSGSTEPNQDMWMWFESSCCRSFQADGSGVWTVDYSVPGAGGEPIADVGLGSAGTINAIDNDGDNTSLNWNVPNKTLHVVPAYPEVHGHDWPSGANVTLTIDNDTNSGNGVLYTETKNADEDPLWCGYPCFDLNGVLTLEVGQYVTLTDGANIKTVQVSPLTVTAINTNADTISGIANPGSRVAVNIWSQDGLARYVTTGLDGTWIADFSEFGDEDFEQFTTDITYGDNGRAIQLNPDGTDDGTLEYWDATPPAVTSIVRADANPTANASVDFTVTFSESVTGVNIGDFHLTTTGVTGASISAVSGFGDTYLVKADTGSGDGTIRLDVVDNDSINDTTKIPLGGGGTGNGNFTTGEVYIVDKSSIFKSIGSQDGWILESSETSNKGGTMNSTATLLYIGDNAQDKQYKSILSFNTGGLPNNATITKVQLRVRVQGFTGGNMFTPAKTHGSLLMDIRKTYFGASAGLEVIDFQSAAGKNSVGALASAPTAGWYTVTLNSTAYDYINKSGTTQFRLRFQKDDNDDMAADYIQIYSGNAGAANRPQLIIEYYVP